MKAKPFVWFSKMTWALAAATFVNPEVGGGNLYQDPQGRFTVRLAGGWTASALDQNTVQFTGDGAYAKVFVLRGGGTAEELIYYQQLGTEYAHDPVTGENFLMNYGADYRNSGPEGPGFYRQVGSDLRKLEPGRTE